MKKEKNNKSVNSDKKKLGTRFMDTLKKRWLISRTNTLLLIAILIAIVILINSVFASLELTPIDCTANNEYTLTEQSKERIKDITNTVNIYFIGFEEGDATISLAKQYNKVNENINVEEIDINERTDIASKYNIESSSQVIIVENGEKSKLLYSDDLYTYDSSYNTIDLTEEKITSAVLNVSSDKLANVYFLTGYSDYSLDYSGGMSYLAAYLEDEVLNYNTLDMLVTGSIPDDCDTLVITTPTKDFDELTTSEIKKYINNGGNILWLNSSYAEKLDLPNVNSILELYGIDPFDVGYVYETDSDKMALGYASCIVSDLGNTEIDADLNNAILLNPTKINVNDDKVEELGIEEQDIIYTEDTSYFRTNISSESTDVLDDDVQGGFTIGGMFTKTISDETEESDEAEEETNTTDETTEEDNSIKSTLVIFGDNNFISDMQINSQVYPMVFLYNNKDLVLNSIAYLTDQDEGITIRKDYTKVSTFTATDAQKLLILRIIFIVPIAIIILGIIIWQVRRKK